MLTSRNQVQALNFCETLKNDATFWVGVSELDISPNQRELNSKKIYLGGYDISTLRGFATSVHDPIFVKTMIISDCQKIFALSILDLPGLGNSSYYKIQSLVERKFGLSTANLNIGVTHTHSGPDFQGPWGGVLDSYRTRVENLVVDSIGIALKGMKPAFLQTSSTFGPNLNRRGWHFTDPEINTLQAIDAESGKSIGLLVNFAAHPVIVSTERKVSRDFIGYTTDELQALYGGVIIFSQGILGDALPLFVKEGHEKARAYGLALAQQISLSMSQMNRIQGRIKQTHIEIEFEIENIIYLLFNEIFKLNYIFDRKENRLSVLTRMNYLAIGNVLSLLTYPGEALTRAALPIKNSMQADFKMILGLTGDSLGYFIPSDEYLSGRNDFYEEMLCLNKQAADRIALLWKNFFNSQAN